MEVENGDTNRRGPVIKLDLNKLLPAEFAAALDAENYTLLYSWETKQVAFNEDVLELVDSHTEKWWRRLRNVREPLHDAESATI